MKANSPSLQSPLRSRLFTGCLRIFSGALFALSLSSSATQVTFSEVMYQPLPGKPEFLEIQNLSVTPLDMARWQFTDGITFNFPDFNAGSTQAHFLKANERILLSSADDATTRAAYPGIPAAVRIFGPWTGGLDNSGETITLTDKNGVVVTTLTYGDSGKWPVQADGAGHSLVLADLNRAPDDWRVWRASTNRGGSPGIAKPAVPATGLALNEFHFAANAHVDWIEVRNNSRTTTVTGGTMFLASKDDFSDKVSIAGSIPAGAVASVTLDFASDNDGDITLYLLDASNNVRDAVTIRRKVGRDAWQVFPAGSREWYAVTTDTRNAQNNPARNTDIVINEIMADPPSNQRDAEFIELYNRGPAAVNIGGWTLDDAVNFTFPAGTTIPPGGYVVIGANASYLNASYGGVSALGNWTGSLRNSGDRIRLEDADGNLANQVDYRFGGEWPELAGGNGSSLELVHPSAENAFGSAWADSDESAKSAFTSFTMNLGTYLDRTQGVNDDELLMWLVGDGHLILRNIVLRPTAGSTNVLANAGVTTLANQNISGWQARGTHWQSFSDAEGVHIVADGHGDNKCNHIEKDASTASGTPGLVLNQAYTLTFDARWVYGKPRLVTQSWDLSIGGTTRVPIPLNLGTPGAPNSRLAAASAPQVTAMSNIPVVPTLNSTVTVTTRVASADALGGVTLFHRLDNITNTGAWNSLAMNDAGTGGDAFAGDGIYTGQILLSSFSGVGSNGLIVSYSALGSIVQFYVRATATNGLSTDLPKGGASTPALWVCDNQNPGPELRRMRVVMSAYWGDALSQDSPTGGHTSKFNFKFPRLSNHYFPCTFILNDSEVFHGSFVRKTGSPFTRSTSNALDRGRVVLAGDRDFRDKGRLYWDNDSGTTMLHNRIVRYWLYLFGVPGNENEVCRITKNNATYTVRETNEAFDKDMLDRIWPDGSDGKFFEMDDAFWIADDGATRLANSDGSFDYKGTDSQGEENPTAYHNNFTPKSREVDYDYSSLIAWFKQIEQNGAITAEQMERMVDVRALAAYAAVRGYIADWDNITMSRGKNGFFYQRSTDQRFTFLHWDSDLGFQSSRIDDSIVSTNLTNVGTFYAKPYVRRYLNFYLNQLLTAYAANGPRITAWLAAEEASSNWYSINSVYSTWPTTVGGGGVTRPVRIQEFIGDTSRLATFTLSAPGEGATVGTNTVDVTGRAPLLAFRVICVGHPEAVFSWTGSAADVAPWRLAGIQIASGANVLTFRAFDENGLQIGGDLTRTINRTGNAPPAINLLIDPSSQNVALGEVATLDASSSYDPEGAGALIFSWSVSPATGFSTNILAPAKRQLIFNVPGSYDVTLQVTDANSQISSVTRTLTVFNASDRDDFSGEILTGYAFQNIELLDNYSPNAWYSLNEVSGSLVIQITQSAAKPLNAGTPTFPLITRFLPAATDFSLQTNLSFVNPQLASFVTGLYLETVEGGATTRYAFGLDAGTTVRVHASIAGVAYNPVGSLGYTGGDLVLRVLRTGTSLAFQRRVNGAWANVYTKTLPGGSTVSRGGLFAATNIAQAQRVAFDYLLLSDPGNSTDLVNNLRITEIMYQPAAGGVEYIELRNVGAAPISLNGAYFEDGSPWSSQFTFGNLTLQPSQSCIVTNNPAAFQGTSVVVAAGQATGSLNNDGEHITLKDAQGNIILDFDYSPLAPWPGTVAGRSIEVLSLTSGNSGNGANWRLGVETGGSPGYLGLATDSDRDGAPDSAELAFGTDPFAGLDQPIPLIARDPVTGGVTITWRSQPGRTYTVQYRDKLEDAWQSFTPVVGAGATTSLMDSPGVDAPSRFYRVSTPVP